MGHNENLSPAPAGSIKGDVKRKHFSPRGSRGRSLASSPFRRAGVVATRSSSVGFISALRHSSLAEVTQAWLWSRSAGQPWFYLRLAVRARGTMALLGSPREHTVARETWRPWRTQPNPPKDTYPRTRARSPNRKTRSETRPFPAVPRAQTACGFTYSASNASPFFHTCKVIAAILRRQRQPRHLRSHPFFQKVFVELAERTLAAASRGGRALEQVLQIVVVVAVQPANEHRLLAPLQLAVHHPIVGTAARFQRQPAVGPELPFRAEAVRRLHSANQ